MSSNQALVIVEDQSKQGVVATVSVIGQKKLNVVDEAILRDAKSALEDLLRRPGLRCVVLRGATERAFIGGANLHALRALNTQSAETFIRSINALCTTIRTASIPVIARLQGYCLGAGLEIAAACDLRIGDSTVRCGMPEVRIGVPSVIDAALLPGLIGWGKSRELMLRGNIIDAEQSYRIGLLQHLVEPRDLDTLCDEVVNDVLEGGCRAIALQKHLFCRWQDEGVSEAIESGVKAFVAAYESDEPQEKIDAFFSRSRNR